MSHQVSSSQSSMLKLLAEPQPLLTNQELAYNPTGEWIFPSFLDTTGILPSAPARWLLAYSPHDAPGGICIAWADSLNGAWQEHAQNPVIGHQWDDHYEVSHVASPHLLWLPDQQEIACYFHGENTTTRIAYSADGISWRYGGIMCEAKDVAGWTLDECSYARVFAHQVPEIPGSEFVMLFMGKQPEEGAPGYGMRHIFMATSSDAVTWTPRSEPVLSPPYGWQASGPQLVTLGNALWVLHHQDVMNGQGHLYATPVTANLRRRGDTHMLLAAADRPSADGRLADPLLVHEDGVDHLVWLEGARLSGGFYRAPVQLG